MELLYRTLDLNTVRFPWVAITTLMGAATSLVTALTIGGAL